MVDALTRNAAFDVSGVVVFTVGTYARIEPDRGVLSTVPRGVAFISAAACIVSNTADYAGRRDACARAGVRPGFERTFALERRGCRSPLAAGPIFRLDDEVMGTSGVATLITDATAKDTRGPLPLVRRVRDRVLEFVPSRRCGSGTITFEYRARSISAAEKGALEGLTP